MYDITGKEIFRMMEAQFRQDLSKRTMIVKRESANGDSFREKMLLKNSIRGVARTGMRYLNGESYYTYDMGSCQTLKNVFDGNSMSLKEQKSLLSGIVRVSSELSKYLLDVKDLLMEPEFVFWDLEKEEPVFCYYPDNPDGEDGFLSFGQFLMDGADRSDEEAAAAACDYFERISEGIFLPRDGFRENPEKEKRREKASEKDSIQQEEKIDRIFERGTDSLALSNIWDDEEDDNYYLDGIKENEKEREKKGKLYILLSVIPAILSAGAYAVIFMNPGIMEYLGLRDVDYLAFGGGVMLISGAFIVFGILMWHKKRKEEENRRLDMESLNTDGSQGEYRFDELEERAIEKEMKDTDEDRDSDATVLLSDHSFGGKKTRKPELFGRIGGEERVFRIARTPYMIGKMRNKADAVISDAGVSRLHACIREEEGHYYLSDLNSTNGTSVNERKLKVNETTELFDGDKLRFADVSMTFRLA